jgi:hypothetical protein
VRITVVAVAAGRFHCRTCHRLVEGSYQGLRNHLLVAVADFLSICLADNRPAYQFGLIGSCYALLCRLPPNQAAATEAETLSSRRPRCEYVVSMAQDYTNSDIKVAASLELRFRGDEAHQPLLLPLLASQ